MLEFNRTEIDQFAVHYVGNKGNGEELSCSNGLFKFKEDFVKESLKHYFLTPFKTDIFYQFSKGNAIKIHDVHSFVDEIFSDPSSFHTNSVKIANRLYDSSIHPKIKGGELYITLMKDCKVKGEVCDAIGIFKSESRETYLRVFQQVDEFDIEAEQGININKLDKGCIIFNTQKEFGYKISIVDNSFKVAEAALYWTEDFLSLKMREDNFYYTNHLINTCKNFCEEVLTEENNVAKPDQLMMMNKSMNYFKEHNKFNLKEFEKEVIQQPEIVEAFRDYRAQYNDEHKVKNDIEDFDISPTAIKKNTKFMRSVIKLDKNFHVYVHGRHDYIQKGFDEEAGMHFYKLYFSKEE